MANTSENLKYAKSDEWLDEVSGKMGISDYAQRQLSDIVFLEISVEVGDVIESGSVVASVESVKAASDVMAPVGGRVVAINTAVIEAPENINGDPYGSWFIQLEQITQVGLMDATEYNTYCGTRG